MSQRLDVHSARVLWTGVPVGGRRSVECGQLRVAPVGCYVIVY